MTPHREPGQAAWFAVGASAKSLNAASIWSGGSGPECGFDGLDKRLRGWCQVARAMSDQCRERRVEHEREVPFAGAGPGGQVPVTRGRSSMPAHP